MPSTQQNSNPEPIEVFTAYSHKDARLRDKLESHLSLLKQQGTITTWHDRKIIPGKDWEQEIDKHLNSATVILLLISADFLESAYCYGIEMKRALSRHDAGKATVLPVILRPVDWHGAPFGKLQALPRDGKPITTWPTQDEGFVDVAKGVRRAINELVAKASFQATSASTRVTAPPSEPISDPPVAEPVNPDPSASLEVPIQPPNLATQIKGSDKSARRLLSVAIVTLLVLLAVIAFIVAQGENRGHPSAASPPPGEPIYGPASGKLGAFITPSPEYNADLKVRDFFTSARFYNPTGPSEELWHYGFAFRNIGEINPANSKEYQLFVSSNKNWSLTQVYGLDWIDLNSTHHYVSIAEGRVEGFNNAEGGFNDMSLSVVDKTGLFYVNGEFIAQLDVSGTVASGNVLLALNAPNTRNATRFEDFTVWLLDK
jgi:TIR domain